LIVVIKGGSISGATRFAAHLERTDTNERRNDVIEMRDVAAPDLRGALREMEAVASACPNCKKPLYQASINTQAHERLTDEQRMQAVDRLEKELGLTGQPRVVVVHEKNDGREHCHVVWSRIDLDKMRSISDSHNFRKHEMVARELEREFGHERVQGAHIERDGQPRPPRTPSHKDVQQGARTGVSPKAARGHLTALWQRADNGKAFAEGLAQSGWILARGDRRDFVAIDQKGGTHSLSRRIEGATAKDIRARLADLKPEKLPSVAEARATQQARHAPEVARQAAPIKTPTKAPARSPAQASVSRSPAFAKATADKPEASKGREATRAADGAALGAVRAAGGVAKAAGKIMDGLASAFEGLLGGGSNRPSASAEASADRQEMDREGQGQAIDDNRRPLDAGAPLPPAARAEAARREDDQKSTRRQDLLREYGREIPAETEQDAKIERDQRNRGGGRERER
jgi:Relaxase/Mobilisation nuclease domain